MALSINDGHNAHYQGTNKLTLGIVLGVLTFWLFAQSVVNIVPAINVDVKVPLSSLNFAISLTALISGCCVVVAGGFADKFGRVRLTNIGFLLNILGSIFIILAKEDVLFSIGRAIQGVSAACIMPTTLALVKTYYQDKERQKVLSFWSMGSWGGSGLCSLFGGIIATYMGWHWIFILSIAVSILGMFLIRETPESKNSEESNGSFDYLGLVFFILALVSLNILITKGGTASWNSFNFYYILLIVFFVSIFLFFRIERIKKHNGFIDFSLFKNKCYFASTFSNFMLNSSGGTLMISSLYVQQGRGFTSFQAGVMTIGYLVSVLVMIRVGERLLQKVGAKKPMVWGSLLAAVGVCLMSLTFLSNLLYVIDVFIGYILFGIGLGIYATPSTDTAIMNTPEDKVGVASGIYKMASSLGAAFGLAISSSVYALFIPNGISTAATFGIMVSVLFCMLSVMVILFLLPNDNRVHDVIK